MVELMRDPVCGMELDVRDAVASAVTEGRRFYFCCPRCHAALLDIPHGFVGWAGDTPGPSPAVIVTRASARLEPCHFPS